MESLNFMNKNTYSSIIASAFMTFTFCYCGTSEETNNVKLKLIKTSEKYKHYNQDGPNSLIIMTTPGHAMAAESMNSVVNVFAENQKDYYKNIFTIDNQRNRDSNQNISVQVNTKKIELEDLQNQELLETILEDGFEVLNIANSQGAQVAFDLIPHLDKIFYSAPIHTLSINGCVKGGRVLHAFESVENNPMVKMFGFNLGDFSTSHNGIKDLFPNVCAARISKIAPNDNLYFVGSTIENSFNFITQETGLKIGLLDTIKGFIPPVNDVLNFYSQKESDGFFTAEEQILNNFPNTIVKGYMHDAVYNNKDYMNITAAEYTKMRFNSSTRELEKEFYGIKLN